MLFCTPKGKKTNKLELEAQVAYKWQQSCKQYDCR